MTTLIVARGQSPEGESSQSWVEGTNFFTNPGYEVDEPADTNWGVYNATETLTRVTSGPIAGTASLRLQTLDEDVAGVDWTSPTLINARDWIRYRFKVKAAGDTGMFYAYVKLTQITGSGGNPVFRFWEGVPTSEIVTAQIDLIAPEANVFGDPPTGHAGTYRPKLMLRSSVTPVDVLLDDFFVGIITPA